MLSINKLVYQWPGSTSQQVNLEASAGKIVLISGPSGIGKSTFFDIISGFHEPISGSVIFREENLLEKPPWKRPVSTMFQSNNFFPHLSVEDNLRLSIKKPPYQIEKIKKKLLYLDILPIVNRKTSKLSGGELQRTALIKTLLRE